MNKQNSAENTKEHVDRYRTSIVDQLTSWNQFIQKDCSKDIGATPYVGLLCALHKTVFADVGHRHRATNNVYRYKGLGIADLRLVTPGYLLPQITTGLDASHFNGKYIFKQSAPFLQKALILSGAKHLFQREADKSEYAQKQLDEYDEAIENVIRSTKAKFASATTYSGDQFSCAAQGLAFENLPTDKEMKGIWAQFDDNISPERRDEYVLFYALKTDCARQLLISTLDNEVDMPLNKEYRFHPKTFAADVDNPLLCHSDEASFVKMIVPSSSELVFEQHRFASKIKVKLEKMKLEKNPDPAKQSRLLSQQTMLETFASKTSANECDPVTIPGFLSAFITSELFERYHIPLEMDDASGSKSVLARLQLQETILSEHRVSSEFQKEAGLKANPMLELDARAIAFSAKHIDTCVSPGLFNNYREPQPSVSNSFNGIEDIQHKGGALWDPSFLATMYNNLRELDSKKDQMTDAGFRKAENEVLYGHSTYTLLHLINFTDSPYNAAHWLFRKELEATKDGYNDNAVPGGKKTNDDMKSFQVKQDVPIIRKISHQLNLTEILMFYSFTNPFYFKSRVLQSALALYDFKHAPILKAVKKQKVEVKFLPPLSFVSRACEINDADTDICNTCHLPVYSVDSTPIQCICLVLNRAIGRLCMRHDINSLHEIKTIDQYYIPPIVEGDKKAVSAAFDQFTTFRSCSWFSASGGGFASTNMFGNKRIKRPNYNKETTTLYDQAASEAAHQANNSTAGSTIPSKSDVADGKSMKTKANPTAIVSNIIKRVLEKMLHDDKSPFIKECTDTVTVNKHIEAMLNQQRLSDEMKDLHMHYSRLNSRKVISQILESLLQRSTNKQKDVDYDATESTTNDDANNSSKDIEATTTTTTRVCEMDMNYDSEDDEKEEAVQPPPAKKLRHNPRDDQKTHYDQVYKRLLAYAFEYDIRHSKLLPETVEQFLKTYSADGHAAKAEIAMRLSNPKVILCIAECIMKYVLRGFPTYFNNLRDALAETLHIDSCQFDEIEIEQVNDVKLNRTDNVSLDTNAVPDVGKRCMTNDIFRCARHLSATTDINIDMFVPSGDRPYRQIHTFRLLPSVPTFSEDGKLTMSNVVIGDDVELNICCPIQVKLQMRVVRPQFQKDNKQLYRSAGSKTTTMDDEHDTETRFPNFLTENHTSNNKRNILPASKLHAIVERMVYSRLDYGEGNFQAVSTQIQKYIDNDLYQDNFIMLHIVTMINDAFQLFIRFISDTLLPCLFENLDERMKYKRRIDRLFTKWLPSRTTGKLLADSIHNICMNNHDIAWVMYNLIISSELYVPGTGRMHKDLHLRSDDFQPILTAVMIAALLRIRICGKKSVKNQSDSNELAVAAQAQEDMFSIVSHYLAPDGSCFQTINPVHQNQPYWITTSNQISSYVGPDQQRVFTSVSGGQATQQNYASTTQSHSNAFQKTSLLSFLYTRIMFGMENDKSPNNPYQYNSGKDETPLHVLLSNYRWNFTELINNMSFNHWRELLKSYRQHQTEEGDLDMVECALNKHDLQIESIDPMDDSQRYAAEEYRYVFWPEVLKKLESNGGKQNSRNENSIFDMIDEFEDEYDDREDFGFGDLIDI